MNKSD